MGLCLRHAQSAEAIPQRTRLRRPGHGRNMTAGAGCRSSLAHHR
jgi:hypothetical protein